MEMPRSGGGAAEVRRKRPVAPPRRRLPGCSLQTPAGYKEGAVVCDRNARNGRTVCGPSTCALRYRT